MKTSTWTFVISMALMAGGVVLLTTHGVVESTMGALLVAMAATVSRLSGVFKMREEIEIFSGVFGQTKNKD